MPYTVRMRGVIVGRSDLERSDAAEGRRAGAFRPGPGYDLVQPVFRLHAEATDGSAGDVTDPIKLDRYYRARDALRLELVDSAGKTIPTSSIHIIDRGTPAIELEVILARATGDY